MKYHVDFQRDLARAIVHCVPEDDPQQTLRVTFAGPDARSHALDYKVWRQDRDAALAGASVESAAVN